MKKNSSVSSVIVLLYRSEVTVEAEGGALEQII
jgi:hypothetical protein